MKDWGAGIIRGCLWAGSKARRLCRKSACCAPCPHQAQLRILQLVPFLTVQGEAVPAATWWLAQGCNPAGGIFGAACSGTSLLAVFTFLSSLETRSLWVSEASTSSGLVCVVPPHAYMLGSPDPVRGVWWLCAYVTDEKSTPPALSAGCHR